MNLKRKTCAKDSADLKRRTCAKDSTDLKGMTCAKDSRPCDRHNSSFLERALVALREQMCQGCNVTTGWPKVARATMAPAQESMSQGTLGATPPP